MQVITDKNIGHSAVVVAVDLSRPDMLWHTLDKSLSAIRARVDKVLGDMATKDTNTPQALRAAARARFSKDHADGDMVDPIAIPMVILGLKYDLFRNLDPSDRKVMCKAVRFRAHAAGASVLFHSDADEALPGYTVGMCK